MKVDIPERVEYSRNIMRSTLVLNYYTITKGSFRYYRKSKKDFQPVISARQHTMLYTEVQQYSVQYSVQGTDRCVVAVEVW